MYIASQIENAVLSSWYVVSILYFTCCISPSSLFFVDSFFSRPVEKPRKCVICCSSSGYSLGLWLRMPLQFCTRPAVLSLSYVPFFISHIFSMSTLKAVNAPVPCSVNLYKIWFFHLLFEYVQDFGFFPFARFLFVINLLVKNYVCLVCVSLFIWSIFSSSQALTRFKLY